MADPLIDVAADLQRRGEPFVLATVVRCEAPTSAKPGAKALVHADGRVEGWVGGACAEPVLIREALKALRDGRPRLVGLYGEGGRQPGRTEGILDYAMTCHSGGTLEIYVEPYLPTPQLVLVGHGPVIDALETLGRAAGYSLVPLRDASAWARLDPSIWDGAPRWWWPRTRTPTRTRSRECYAPRRATSASSPAGSGRRRSSGV